MLQIEHDIASVLSGDLGQEIKDKIEEAKERHQKELDDLIKACKDLDMSSKEEKAESSSKAPEQEATPSGESAPVATKTKSVYFPDCKWEDLRKKDLESALLIRGLRRKGNREEVIKKLQKFQADQEKRVQAGLVDRNNVYVDEKKSNKAVDVEDSKPKPVPTEQVQVRHKNTQIRIWCCNKRDSLLVLLMIFISD